MCFFKDPEQPTHNVAKEDLICYKIYLKDMRDSSIFHPMLFHNRMKYKVGDTIKPNDKIRVSYLDKELVLTNGVIHSYTREQINKLVAGKRINNDVAVIQCIIPAGTAYWKNRLGEYASKKVIIQEVIH